MGARSGLSNLIMCYSTKFSFVEAAPRLPSALNSRWKSEWRAFQKECRKYCSFLPLKSLSFKLRNTVLVVIEVERCNVILRTLFVSGFRELILRHDDCSKDGGETAQEKQKTSMQSNLHSQA